MTYRARNSTLFIIGIFWSLILFNIACSMNRELSSKLNDRILTQHDEATVRAVIIDEMPNFAINSLKLVSNGWDNLVADVNGEWIFRFAREKEFISVLEREQLLLDRLHHYISIPIPYYELFGTHIAFVGYRKIFGETILDEALYLTLSDQVRQEIAETLALFCSQLHKMVSVDEALRWGYKRYEVPLELIENSVVGTIQSSHADRLIREALAYIKQYPYGHENLVLLHNDLHGGNFTLDVNTHKVVGIFDFSDAVIGNSFIEFAQIFNIHYDLALRTMEAYARLNGNDVVNSSKNAAVEYILRRARYIHGAREQRNGAREERLIRQLERFALAWDNLFN